MISQDAFLVSLVRLNTPFCLFAKYSCHVITCRLRCHTLRNTNDDPGAKQFCIYFHFDPLSRFGCDQDRTSVSSDVGIQHWHHSDWHPRGIGGRCQHERRGTSDRLLPSPVQCVGNPHLVSAPLHAKGQLFINIFGRIQPREFVAFTISGSDQNGQSTGRDDGRLQMVCAVLPGFHVHFGAPLRLSPLARWLPTHHRSVKCNHPHCHHHRVCERAAEISQTVLFAASIP